MLLSALAGYHIGINATGVTHLWPWHLHLYLANISLYFSLLYMHVLMRDEKEGRKKQARSNKQQGKATQHIQGSHFS